MQVGKNLCRRLLLASIVASLSSGCVSLDKGAEANVPTVTCVLVFGDGCRFENDNDDRVTLIKRVDEEIKKTRTRPFPPVGLHRLP